MRQLSTQTVGESGECSWESAWSAACCAVAILRPVLASAVHLDWFAARMVATPLSALQRTELADAVCKSASAPPSTLSVEKASFDTAPPQAAAPAPPPAPPMSLSASPACVVVPAAAIWPTLTPLATGWETVDSRSVRVAAA